MSGSITIDYPLPILDYIPLKYHPHIRQAFYADGFKSDHLDCSVHNYHISNDGHLYLVNDPAFESNAQSFKVKIYHHGHMTVSIGIFLDEDRDDVMVYTYDLWIEYDLKFTDGLLVDAKMLLPTKEEINELY